MQTYLAPQTDVTFVTETVSSTQVLKATIIAALVKQSARTKARITLVNLDQRLPQQNPRAVKSIKKKNLIIIKHRVEAQ